MIRYNITTSRSYESNGQEKKMWPIVGTMIKFEAGNGKPEGFKIELNMFPGTSFHVFEQKAPESRRTDAEPVHDIDAETGQIRPASHKESGKNTPPKVVGAIEYPTEEINPDDIPF